MTKLLLFILFLSLLFSFGNEGWLKYYRLRRYEQSFEDQNKTLAQENLSLRKEVMNLKEPKYVEHYIRKELGYIKNNEIIYEIQSP